MRRIISVPRSDARRTEYTLVYSIYTVVSTCRSALAPLAFDTRVARRPVGRRRRAARVKPQSSMGLSQITNAQTVIVIYLSPPRISHANIVRTPHATALHARTERKILTPGAGRAICARRARIKMHGFCNNPTSPAAAGLTGPRAWPSAFAMPNAHANMVVAPLYTLTRGRLRWRRPCPLDARARLPSTSRWRHLADEFARA